jgi:hypothetical protein
MEFKPQIDQEQFAQDFLPTFLSVKNSILKFNIKG